MHVHSLRDCPNGFLGMATPRCGSGRRRAIHRTTMGLSIMIHLGNGGILSPRRALDRHRPTEPVLVQERLLDGVQLVFGQSEPLDRLEVVPVGLDGQQEARPKQSRRASGMMHGPYTRCSYSRIPVSRGRSGKWSARVIRGSAEAALFLPLTRMTVCRSFALVNQLVHGPTHGERRAPCPTLRRNFSRRVDVAHRPYGPSTASAMRSSTASVASEPRSSSRRWVVDRGRWL